MSRTLWTIASLGFVTVVLLTISFLVVFKSFRDSPSSQNAKLAVAIREEFHVDAVTARIVSETQKTALLVQYETHADTKFSVDAQNEEMKAISIFALGKLNAFEQKRVDEVRLRRYEIHGSGCFQRTYNADLTVPNPFRAAPGTFPTLPSK